MIDTRSRMLGKPLVRFCEGSGTTRAMGEILWHRRETRRKTEKTNVALQLGECPVYSKRRALDRRRALDPELSSHVGRHKGRATTRSTWSKLWLNRGLLTNAERHRHPQAEAQRAEERPARRSQPNAGRKRPNRNSPARGRSAPERVAALSPAVYRWRVRWRQPHLAE